MEVSKQYIYISIRRIKITSKHGLQRKFSPSVTEKEKGIQVREISLLNKYHAGVVANKVIVFVRFSNDQKPALINEFEIAPRAAVLYC